VSLMGSALARGGSVLEPAGVGTAQREGSSWCHLTEATPAALLLPQPCREAKYRCPNKASGFPRSSAEPSVHMPSDGGDVRQGTVPSTARDAAPAPKGGCSSPSLGLQISWRAALLETKKSQEVA